jgi:hypothetical protein
MGMDICSLEKEMGDISTTQSWQFLGEGQDFLLCIIPIYIIKTVYSIYSYFKNGIEIILFVSLYLC